jgi:sucrose-6-phosphate hydrolase SacC (GH32 family)
MVSFVSSIRARRMWTSAMCRFYQHLPTGCEWDWGLVWGHAVSPDLVHWEHLPPALVPTPGKLDADGCFSGCCAIDTDGVPTILYTGVRLRSNQDCGPHPPTECDLNLPFIESQLIARCLDPSERSAQKALQSFCPVESINQWQNLIFIQTRGLQLEH